MNEYKEPFESVGLTPPRGRQGHSVPTARPLSGRLERIKPLPPGADIPVILPLPTNTAPVAVVTNKYGPSPAQFYAHRDHVLGGSLSKLDRMQSRPGLACLETFTEAEEEHPVGSEALGQNRYFSDLAAARRGFTLNDFTGDSLLHYSYSVTGRGGQGLTTDSQLGGSFINAFTQGLSSSLNVPFLGQTSSSPGGDMNTLSALFPTTARNPNKAIITIDAQTSRILVANEMTCELFGYQRIELIDMKVQNLFTEPYRAEHRALVEQNIDSSGKTVLISGKVMDAVTSYGIEFPVSVWMKRVGTSHADTSTSPGVSRVIVIVEPVERSSAHFAVNHDGKIVSCDPWFACLFGFEDVSEILNTSVSDVIPSLQLPTKLDKLTMLPIKQAITGRSKDGTVFPLTVKFTDVSQNCSVGDLYSPTSISNINPLDKVIEAMSLLSSTAKPSDADSPTASSVSAISEGNSPVIIVSENDGDTQILSGNGDDSSSMEGDTFLINAKVVVYAGLSGMISFLPDGTIHGCNNQFSLMLFGYGQQELLKMDITHIIPDFYHNINYIDDQGMALPPLDEDQEDLFHSAMERSMSPERAYELVEQTELSPKHRRISDHQRSPARRALNILSANVVHSVSLDHPKLAPVEHVNSAPLSKAMLTKVAADISCESVGLNRQPVLGNVSTHGPSSVEKPKLTVNCDDVTSSFSYCMDPPHDSPKHNIIQLGSTLEVTSSVSNTTSEMTVTSSERLEPPALEVSPNPVHPVPTRLVPSQSTERIMEILKQYDLQKERATAEKHQRPKVSDNSSTEFTEDGIEKPLSSTPAKLSAHLQRGGMSPDMQYEQVQFSVGLHRRSSYESDIQSLSSVTSLPEGTYLGEARHKDGSLLAIVFQLKCITLADHQQLFCVWISRDLDQDRARNADLSMSMNQPLDPYRNEQLISPDLLLQSQSEFFSANQPTHHAHTDKPPGLQPVKISEQQLAIEGEYCLNYNTLKAIGKGAFGFVRLAQRKEDGTLVVVKFLRKSSVLKDCWMEDVEMGHVPLEISLLASLSHPNIVQLLEAYENEFFFQMVMAKHGDGLDLFEFIEMNPQLNEPIISFMFRQVVAGLAYLHEHSILHRDIKDENIIVNQKFHLKLIDFGSAAYMAPSKLFNTFCGTLEYCSPEVLLGNNYAGPELEMWALGVTLYTLVFGENPFFDVEETISGHLQPPFLTSPALMKVLFWLLHPDPRSRATLKDLQEDKWTNQAVDMSLYSFEVVLGHLGSSNGPVKNPAASGVPSVLAKSNSENNALFHHHPML